MGQEKAAKNLIEQYPAIINPASLPTIIKSSKDGGLEGNILFGTVGSKARRWVQKFQEAGGTGGLIPGEAAKIKKQRLATEVIAAMFARVVFGEADTPTTAIMPAPEKQRRLSSPRTPEEPSVVSEIKTNNCQHLYDFIYHDQEKETKNINIDRIKADLEKNPLIGFSQYLAFKFIIGDDDIALDDFIIYPNDYKAPEGEKFRLYGVDYDHAFKEIPESLDDLLNPNTMINKIRNIKNLAAEDRAEWMMNQLYKSNNNEWTRIIGEYGTRTPPSDGTLSNHCLARLNINMPDNEKQKLEKLTNPEKNYTPVERTKTKELLASMLDVESMIGVARTIANLNEEDLKLIPQKLSTNHEHAKDGFINEKYANTQTGKMLQIQANCKTFIEKYESQNKDKAPASQHTEGARAEQANQRNRSEPPHTFISSRKNLIHNEYIGNKYLIDIDLHLF